MVTIGAVIAWTFFVSFMTLLALGVLTLSPRKPPTAIEDVPEPDDEFWGRL